MIFPASISIKSIFPGCNRHFVITLLSSTGSVPASEAKTTVSSSDTKYLAGLNPFLSSVAPIFFPSVKAIAAGPSQGSIIDA